MKEFGLFIALLRPSACFLLFKTKMCRTWRPAGSATCFRVATGPAGAPSFVAGWKVSAWAVCALVSPWAFEGWRGRREVSPDMWVCASPEGRAGEGRRRKGEVTGGGGGGGPGFGCRGSCWAVMVMTRWKWRIFRNTIPAPDIPEAAAVAASPPGFPPRPTGSL